MFILKISIKSGLPYFKGGVFLYGPSTLTTLNDFFIQQFSEMCAEDDICLESFLEFKVSGTRIDKLLFDDYKHWYAKFMARNRDIVFHGLCNPALANNSLLATTPSALDGPPFHVFPDEEFTKHNPGLPSTIAVFGVIGSSQNKSSQMGLLMKDGLLGDGNEANFNSECFLNDLAEAGLAIFKAAKSFMAQMNQGSFGKWDAELVHPKFRSTQELQERLFDYLQDPDLEVDCMTTLCLELAEALDSIAENVQTCQQLQDKGTALNSMQKSMLFKGKAFLAEVRHIIEVCPSIVILQMLKKDDGKYYYPCLVEYDKGPLAHARTLASNFNNEGIARTLQVFPYVLFLFYIYN